MTWKNQEFKGKSTIFSKDIGVPRENNVRIKEKVVTPVDIIINETFGTGVQDCSSTRVLTRVGKRKLYPM